MNTNKIDLIKAEVEKLKSQLLRGACSSQIAMETRCKEEAYNEVLAILDTMQEEPVKCSAYKNPQDCEIYPDCSDCMGNISEEHVSEDFEEALASEWKAYNDRGAATVDALEDNTQELAFAKGFYRGSNWQRNQDQSTIELAEDHAMLAGMEKMKEEMMAKAIDGEVGYWNQRGLSVLMSLPSEFEQDDKCKIILIKED